MLETFPTGDLFDRYKKLLNNLAETEVGQAEFEKFKTNSFVPSRFCTMAFRFKTYDEYIQRSNKWVYVDNYQNYRYSEVDNDIPFLGNDVMFIRVHAHMPDRLQTQFGLLEFRDDMIKINGNIYTLDIYYIISKLGGMIGGSILKLPFLNQRSDANELFAKIPEFSIAENSLYNFNSAFTKLKIAQDPNHARALAMILYEIETKKYDSVDVELRV